MSGCWAITEHVVDGQHLRQYAGAIGDEQQAIKLSVKQYTPLDNPQPCTGDVTIIVAGANGFAKEIYEPFLEQLVLLYSHLAEGEPKIRDIWIADMAQTGRSGILNEGNLGNDPSHFDYARDLLAIINRFRMPQPIVGIGHSVGANALCYVADFHPRLFAALALVEISAGFARIKDPRFQSLVKLTAEKQDLWADMAAVESSLAKSPFFKTWDPRALAKALEHNYRPTPTLLHPQQNMVTLTTTKHQETFLVARPNFRNVGVVDPSNNQAPPTPAARFEVPDIDPDIKIKAPFYRPEALAVYRRLPSLRPPVLYVHGAQSTFIYSAPERRADNVAVTGRGPGGSGSGERVREVELRGGHFLPMENVDGTAAVVAAFVTEEVRRWREVEGEWREGWARLSPRERQTMGPQWEAKLKERWVKKSRM